MLDSVRAGRASGRFNEPPEYDKRYRFESPIDTVMGGLIWRRTCLQRRGGLYRKRWVRPLAGVSERGVGIPCSYCCA